MHLNSKEDNPPVGIPETDDISTCNCKDGIIFRNLNSVRYRTEVKPLDLLKR